MAANTMEEKKVGLSFGFAKKQEVKQLVKSVVDESAEKEDNELDYVLSLEGKEVNSTKSSRKTSKEEYVIPLIKHNKWRTGDKLQNVTNGESLQNNTSTPASESLDELAAKEILQETARYNEDWEERGKDNTNVAIPLLMQNKIPEGFESDEKLDVALRPDEPDDADYDRIPIEHFGMAMLRGMGWNETRGIGKTGKVVAPIEAQLRPKGLGLGADRNNSGSDKKNASENSKDEKGEELELKKNANCVVTAGSSKDLYGTVEGIDEDNSRVMVKLALSGKVVNIMQCSLRLVGKKEYDKYSKYLNKQKADKYKEDEKKKLENGHKDHSGSEESSKSSSHKRKRDKKNHSDSDSDHSASKHRHKKHKKQKEEKQRSDRDRSENDDRNSHRSSKQSRSEHKSSSKVNKRNTHSSDSDDMEDSSASRTVPSWLRNDLRVRVIDKDLKRGKYYKEKVVIIDVPSIGICVCRTEDGKVIEDVRQSSLETVIPRSDSAYVAIVSGTHWGQVGQVMKRDKDKCLALVQLLSDRDTVLRLQYDEICEFVGDIHSHDDY